MSENYYKDLWTKKNGHGDLFWKQVDFSTKAYQFQEHVFRQHLLSLRNLYNLHVPPREIKSVLELGAGTGRMTKIMVEVFPDYNWYTTVDISENNIKKMFKTLGNDEQLPRNVYPLCGDIIEYVNLPRKEGHLKYDFILASEVFMHIKPEDINTLINKLITNLLAPNGVICNIDWHFDPDGAPKEWCFIHDYHKLYTDNGLEPLFTANMETIKQKLFCYGV
jgi:SAM-dependent methyltransferase